ncbi:MAG: ABC transporter permease [Clostridiales Family XIII bacterium]|jgi:osmoprotectant transport system permease protein|nr:ABC transporter permease [Clostridiales Family XIII bacterium]
MQNQNLFEQIITYFSTHTEAWGEAVAQHLLMCFAAVALAMLIGLPLGVFCSKNRIVKTFVTGIFSTLRIIPSLAVLLLCLPVFGPGAVPALIALSFLAIPPILINTTQAFAGVPAEVIETATGLGMSPARMFFRVKAPLAMPLVLAGIKTATAEIIASATLAAYIGAGGLGVMIFTGLGLQRADLLIVGGLSVAILSILADTLLGLLEKRLVRYRNTDIKPMTARRLPHRAA